MNLKKSHNLFKMDLVNITFKYKPKSNRSGILYTKIHPQWGPSTVLLYSFGQNNTKIIEFNKKYCNK